MNWLLTPGLKMMYFRPAEAGTFVQSNSAGWGLEMDVMRLTWLSRVSDCGDLPAGIVCEFLAAGRIAAGPGDVDHSAPAVPAGLELVLQYRHSTPDSSRA